MTAVATLAPLHCLAAALCAEVRDDYLATSVGVVICRPNGRVHLIRHDGTRALLGTLSDGPDVIAARYRALVEVSA